MKINKTQAFNIWVAMYFYSSGTTRGVMVCKLDLQAIISNSKSHWLALSHN